MATKRFALLPSEREKPCPHNHVAYMGRVPNTGPLVCRMCGETFDPPSSAICGHCKRSYLGLWCPCALLLGKLLRS